MSLELLVKCFKTIEWFLAKLWNGNDYSSQCCLTRAESCVRSNGNTGDFVNLACTLLNLNHFIQQKSKAAFLMMPLLNCWSLNWNWLVTVLVVRHITTSCLLTVTVTVTLLINISSLVLIQWFQCRQCNTSPPRSNSRNHCSLMQMTPDLFRSCWAFAYSLSFHCWFLFQLSVYRVERLKQKRTADLTQSLQKIFRRTVNIRKFSFWTEISCNTSVPC